MYFDLNLEKRFVNIRIVFFGITDTLNIMFLVINLHKQLHILAFLYFDLSLWRCFVILKFCFFGITDILSITFSARKCLSVNKRHEFPHHFESKMYFFWLLHGMECLLLSVIVCAPAEITFRVGKLSCVAIKMHKQTKLMSVPLTCFYAA